MICPVLRQTHNAQVGELTFGIGSQPRRDALPAEFRRLGYTLHEPYISVPCTDCHLPVRQEVETRKSQRSQPRVRVGRRQDIDSERSAVWADRGFSFKNQWPPWVSGSRSTSASAIAVFASEPKILTELADRLAEDHLLPRP